jgi:lamin B
MKLEPKGTVTIWSSDATEAVHEPPTSLIMKGQKWFPGDHVTTTLLSNSGDVSSAIIIIIVQEQTFLK